MILVSFQYLASYLILFVFFFFFFNDTATTEIYTLSLHDALPIYACRVRCGRPQESILLLLGAPVPDRHRSEEHTSELQSPCNLVCRLLLEKKKKILLPPLINKKKKKKKKKKK